MFVRGVCLPVFSCFDWLKTMYEYYASVKEHENLKGESD